MIHQQGDLQDWRSSHIRVLIGSCLPVLHNCFKHNWKLRERREWIDRDENESMLWRRELDAHKVNAPMHWIKGIKEADTNAWGLQLTFWLLLRSKIHPLDVGSADHISVAILDDVWKLLQTNTRECCGRFPEIRAAALSLTSKHAPRALPAMQELVETHTGESPHRSLVNEIRRAALPPRDELDLDGSRFPPHEIEEDGSYFPPHEIEEDGSRFPPHEIEEDAPSASHSRTVAHTRHVESLSLESPFGRPEGRPPSQAPPEDEPSRPAPPRPGTLPAARAGPPGPGAGPPPRSDPAPQKPAAAGDAGGGAAGEADSAD